MFENLEVGKKLKRKEFDARELPLREQLLKSQFELAELGRQVIIVIAGLDGSGKGSLVHRLNEWMDPRGIETNTYWEHSDEEESRPFFWRFWRRLPARGQIGMFLGSWYTKPAQLAVTGQMDMGDFDQHLQEIESFERTLTDDGALVIKLWLHVSEKQQNQRLAENVPREHHNLRRSDQPYELQGKYKQALAVSERMILATDTSHSHWQLIEACDPRYRDIAAGEYILKAMQDRTAQQPAVDEPVPELSATEVPAENLDQQPTVLDKVDLSLALDGEKYKRKLDRYQNRLQELGWQAYQQKRSVVAVFEGWDAAGKGSAIRRVTRAMDPRLYRLLQFAAPTDEERAQHYLWRFWRQLQRDGRCTFFDRSWYGRVLVERVEQLATRPQWQRAYSEINQFEQQLVNHGCIVLKFWIHISPDEQERRFRAREQEPRKQYKLTEEDWRNRAKWPEYEIAVDQLVGHTSTTHAPWTLVSGNDKKNARVEILKTFCKTMSQALES